MILYVGLEILTHSLLNIISPVIGKFLNNITVIAHQMVMMLIDQSLLIKGILLLELVFNSESALNKKIKGVVDGGSADGVFLIPHHHEQALDIYVSVQEVQFF